MTIELTNAESTALRELLERHLGDMLAEIAHTDSPTFRSRLREEREQLRSVREKLSV